MWSAARGARERALVNAAHAPPNESHRRINLLLVVGNPKLTPSFVWNTPASNSEAGEDPAVDSASRTMLP